MEYVLIGLSLLLIILLVVLYKMYARIGLLDRTLDRRDLTIKEYQEDNEKMKKELGSLPKIDDKISKSDLLFAKLVEKSDEDEINAMIDFRKAWNWNGKKGVSNE